MCQILQYWTDKRPPSVSLQHSKILLGGYCSQNRCNTSRDGRESREEVKRANLKPILQENKARQIFWKANISYQRNVRFSENLACFVFMKHPFWDSLFCLITGENNKIYSSGCRYRTRSWLVRRLGWQKLLKCKFRSSRLRIFFKIVVLKNFAIFTGENLCWSLFLRKLWSNDSNASVSLWIFQKFEYKLFLKK